MSVISIDPVRENGIRKLCRSGSLISVILVVGTGAWATVTEMPGAIIASGVVAVEDSARHLQHPTGGVVSELFVKEGQRVSRGDVLMKLDATSLQATASAARNQLDEMTARLARLEAERDGLNVVSYPPELNERVTDQRVLRIMVSETNLFRARASALSGQIFQNRERIRQTRSEITSHEQQLEALRKQKEIVVRELDGVSGLAAKNLVPLQRLTQLQREEVQTDGNIGRALAEIAQAQAKIAEIELQISQTTQDFLKDVNTDIRQVQGTIADTREKLVAAQDALDKAVIKSPESGNILSLTANTIGGVISPGTDIALIIPDSGDLVVDAKVASADIDNVHAGAAVWLRFPAFNRATTPEIEGTLDRVAADAVQEPQTKAFQYPVRARVAPDQLTRLGDKKLVPGMPVEVHIRMEARTIMSFLTKPIMDQMARAFKQR